MLLKIKVFWDVMLYRHDPEILNLSAIIIFCWFIFLNEHSSIAFLRSRYASNNGNGVAVVESHGSSLDLFVITDWYGRASWAFCIGRTFRTFLNVLVPSYTLYLGKALSLYWADKALVNLNPLHSVHP
jgi:hypothetical protein